MQSNSFIELRLKDLDDNIEQDLALLKKYEDTLRYEDEPRRKAKYQREIEQLRESANRYQQELNELQRQIISEPNVHTQTVAIQLQQVNTKLDRLSAGQKAIYENINHLRQGLLARYKDSEQNIIAAITEQLDQAQITTISTILDALEADQVSEGEMQNILQSIHLSLTTLQQRGIALPAYQKTLAELINAPEINTKHRLKVSLPIIPFLLDYEGELELGTGIELKRAWQKLLTRFRGE